MSRFGEENQDIIKKEIQHLMPDNTKKSKISIWKQFLEFCNEKSYNIQEKLAVEELASILEDYSFNMRKKNSEEYKESVVKVMWNSTAKQLQELYYEEFKVKFGPFSDITFKNARAARDAKRRKLRKDPTKRKLNALALSDAEYMKIVELWDEDCPEGLQRKFFHIASHELAWRGGEGAVANIEYFVEETDNFGKFTGRIEYNPIFSKTTQGGSRKLADSKWLITNINNPTICPVRLFRKMMEKRDNSIETNRLFLTPNPFWDQRNSKGWYKNCPVGKNTIFTWFKSAAQKIGVDTKKVKITNHSTRATAVSNLAKKGIGEQQLIKITGHSSSQSIKPYLQIDEGHHKEIVEAMRCNSKGSCTNVSVSKMMQSDANQSSVITYNNCTFNVTNNNYSSTDQNNSNNN